METYVEKERIQKKSELEIEPSNSNYRYYTFDLDLPLNENYELFIDNVEINKETIKVYVLICSISNQLLQYVAILLI